MLTRILWFLIVLILFSLVRKLLSSLLGSRKTSNRRRTSSGAFQSQPRTISGQTYKDPVCGTYIASSIALTERINGADIFFCSEECRKKYLESRNQQQNDISAPGE